MKKTFFGGIHPGEKKQMSLNGAPTVLTVRQVAIPMVQHIGTACTPLVKPGDRVLVGQKIGDGDGLCAPVHASVSGIVRALEDRPHPSGKDVLSVVIENDFREESVPRVANDQPLSALSPDWIVQTIREAGIVGMGGAAFPTHQKALSSRGHTQTLIANACECEPYITTDDILLRHFPWQVLEGLRILARLLDAAHIVLAMEDNKMAAKEAVGDFLPDFPEISLKILPTRYPQGSEKQLIQAVTGIQVPPGQLPAAVGCAVFNVSTCAAVFRAVRLGESLTHRLVTVSGEGVKNPGNVLVPLGASFADVIAHAGGLVGENIALISGGPMMGILQSNPDARVVKATNAILCLPKRTAFRGNVCLRCGKCVEVCPMRLLPLYLYRYTQWENVRELNRYRLKDCIGCGCCAYVCPGNLPLTAVFRRGKSLLAKEAGK